MAIVTIELCESTAKILRDNLKEHSEQCFGCASSIHATEAEVKLYAVEAAANKVAIDQIEAHLTQPVS